MARTHASEPEDGLRGTQTIIPTSNSTMEVFNPQGAGPGAPCQWSGTTKPSGQSFDSMFFKISSDAGLTNDYVCANPDATLSCQDLYPNGYTTSSPAANWDQSLAVMTALCSPAAAYPTNTLYAVARSYDLDPMATMPMNQFITRYDSDTATNVAGKCVPACTDKAKAAAAKAAKSLLASRDVSPRHIDGEWLLYTGINVANGFFGSRLMRHGQPLRARLIEVVAADVNWSYVFTGGSQRWHVRRAIGDGTVNFAVTRFPFALANSVVVWQKPLPFPFTVVASESREHPEFVHVDPAVDIHAQANYISPFQSSLRGSFSLWVKVVD